MLRSAAVPAALQEVGEAPALVAEDDCQVDLRVEGAGDARAEAQAGWVGAAVGGVDGGGGHFCCGGLLFSFASRV